MRPLRDAGPPRPLGSLYLHVPFCRDRCTYCAFPTVHDEPALHEPLIAALGDRLRATGFPGPLRTLYLGGGTPGLLAPSALTALLDDVRSSVPFVENVEVTLEVNPLNVTADALSAWRASGVTRLSVGVQTFDDAVLRGLARLHDGGEARRALDLVARRWDSTWSADLLVGWHGQGVPALLSDVDTLLSFSPPHVSVYGLTVEPRTPLALRLAGGHAVAAPETLHLPLDSAWSQRLLAGGLSRYEVSNFARPGHRSRHNQAYWANEEYVGLGPGAASSRDALRWIERENVRDWIAASRAGAGVRRAVERVSPAQRLLESVSVGLRTRDGASVAELDRRFGAGWRERVLPAAAALLADGVLQLGATLRLRDDQLVRADAVARSLSAACLAEASPDARAALAT